MAFLFHTATRSDRAFGPMRYPGGWFALKKWHLWGETGKQYPILVQDKVIGISREEDYFAYHNLAIDINMRSMNTIFNIFLVFL